MNNNLLILFLFFGFFQSPSAQQRKIDSLQNILLSIKEDTSKITVLNTLSFLYNNLNPDKGLIFAEMADSIARKENYHTYDSETYGAIASSFWSLGDYDKSLNYYLKKLKIVEQKNDSVDIVETYRYIVSIFIDMKKYKPALKYLHKILNISVNNGYKISEAGAYDYLGIIYLKQNDTIKARTYWEKALKIYTEEDVPSRSLYTCSYLGKLYQRTGDFDKALKYHMQSLKISSELEDNWGIGVTMNYIGNVYFEKRVYDEASRYYNQALDTAKKYSFSQVELLSYQNLVNLNKAENNYKSAFEYYELFIALKNKLYSQEKERAISELQIKYETEKKEKENEILRRSEKIKTIIIKAISIISLISLIFAGFVWHLMKGKNRSNKILEEMNEEVTQQKEELHTQTENLIITNEKLEKSKAELALHQKGLEELVKKRTSELEKAKIKAEESDKLKSAFLANMSHEIRTPMNAIVGFAQILSIDNDNKESVQNYISQININANSLLLLIDDILDISRIESEQVNIAKTSFYLNSFIDEINATSLTLHHKDGVIFRINNSEEKSNIKIISDRGRIKQILMNLISNAFKFTKSGHVELGFDIKEQRVLFYVEDSGIGIAKKNFTVIFNRFTKINTQKEELFGGTGLGLSISYRLAKLLGGSLSIESELDKGSTFIFTLPDNVIDKT